VNNNQQIFNIAVLEITDSRDLTFSINISVWWRPYLLKFALFYFPNNFAGLERIAEM